MTADENEDIPATGPAGYADTNDRDIRAKQAGGVTDSEALADDDVAADNIRVLPGTGGPDDVGDVDVDPGEINLSGHPGS